MLSLRISVHEFEADGNPFIGMNSGEYTGVFAPLPVSDEDRAGMQAEVIRRAEHLLAMKDGDDLPPDCDMTLAEIKASIRENVVEHEEAS